METKNPSGKTFATGAQRTFQRPRIATIKRNGQPWRTFAIGPDSFGIILCFHLIPGEVTAEVDFC